MELIRGLYNVRPEHRGCVATIGNFDGVHLGHQAILRQVEQQSSELGVPGTIITFEPLPAEFFAGTEAPARLNRFREKAQLLQQFSVDHLMCLRFNPNLASMQAETFIQSTLVDGLELRHLIVGDDFRFGAQRAGDFEMLQQAGERHGFKVTGTTTFEIDGARVSSTRIREALHAGDCNLAARLLGRPYSVSGRVVHGDKRGRTIGFPTANVLMNRLHSPVRGIFAVEVCGLHDKPLQGVANVGNRPMLDNDTFLLEVYIFDFNEQIYGRHVQVNLCKKIRDEKYYESFELLRQQIDRDAEAARDFFAST